MSRQIDLSKKLSEADREYLLARGREQDVFLNDAEHTDDPEAARVAAYIPGTSVDQAEGVPPTPGGDPLVVNGGGGVEGVPVFGSDPRNVIEGEAFDAGVGTMHVEVEEQEEAETYTGEQWTKAALVAEIERRNAEYGEEYQLAVSGGKKELAARLVDDDNTPEDDEDDDSGNE